MRSARTLRHWIQQLLPSATPCAQQAAWRLVQALLLTYTVELAQLARQLDRAVRAKLDRQYLARWLGRPAWQPTAIYTGLARLVRRYLRRQAQVLLLIDTTCLADGWVVLQVSLPWQRRALPLYRVVYPYAGAQRDQGQALQEALTWLRRHLPGPRRRYVLVLDRGFPSGAWVRQWQAAGWRFVARVKGNWRISGPAYTGQLRHAPLTVGRPVLYPDVVLGWRDPRLRGADPRPRAHAVLYQGPGQQAPWYLVTTETNASVAVRLYAQRMQIEQEFHDLKGPLGLDHLATWRDRERVARLLAWVAVYEWRLAYLWLFEHLASFAVELQVYGPLSWIRTVREWLDRQQRLAARQAPAFL